MIIESITGNLLDIAWPRENGTYDLNDATLSGAYLNDANLRDATLTGATLSGATVIDAGQDNRGYRFVARQGDPMVIAAGCRWLTAAEAREHWANNPECLGKVEMIIAEATRRGWTV